MQATVDVITPAAIDKNVKDTAKTTSVMTLSSVGFSLAKNFGSQNTLVSADLSPKNDKPKLNQISYRPRDTTINITYQVGYWLVDGRKWYSILVGDDGLLARLNGKIELIVMRILFDNNGKEHHLYSNFTDYFSFWHYYLQTSARHRCFNEVAIESQCQKLRFDLDMPDATIEEGEILITKLVYVIYNTLLNYNIVIDFNNDIFVFESHDQIYYTISNNVKPKDAKLSYHVIINNYACLDQLHLQFITKIITNDVIASYDIDKRDQVKLWLDDKVSNKNHPLRMYGSIKPKTHRVKQWKSTWCYYTNSVDKVLINTNLVINTLISNDINKIVVDQKDLAVLQASLLSWTKSCKIINIILPKIENDNIDLVNIDESIVDNVKTWLTKLDLDQIFTVAKPKKGFILLKRRKSSRCPLCLRIHDASDAFIAIANNQAFFRCYRGPGAIKICDDTSKWTSTDGADDENDDAEPSNAGVLVRSNVFDIADRLDALENGQGFLG